MNDIQQIFDRYFEVLRMLNLLKGSHFATIKITLKEVGLSQELEISAEDRNFFIAYFEGELALTTKKIREIVKE